jgi:hypothetical protein
LSLCDTAHPLHNRFAHIFDASISEATMRPNRRCLRNPSRSAARSVAASRSRRCAARVRPHCRFRNRGTEYVSDSGAKWMSSSTRRQCDRALCAAPRPQAEAGDGLTRCGHSRRRSSALGRRASLARRRAHRPARRNPTPRAPPTRDSVAAAEGEGVGGASQRAGGPRRPNCRRGGRRLPWPTSMRARARAMTAL